MAIILYRLFILLYKAGAICLSPFNKKARLWLSGRKDAFPRLERMLEGRNKPVAWFHCASLGEFEQARPLMEAIRNQYPDYNILLSFFSPSGFEIRKDYSGADYVTYLPQDTKANAFQFISLVKPALVIWIKYDYWFFYLQAIKNANIPLVLVSGVFRPSQPFFKWYGNLHRQMLSFFTGFFVQNETSRELLETIGFSENVIISGDTRFDRVIEIAAGFETVPFIESFINGSPCVVAGSTWEEDEEELDHYANSNLHLKFLIAPHELDEERLTDIEKLFHNSVRYSQLALTDSKEVASKANVLIIDNIGMLSRLYKYATVTYVGGGFGADGIHNILEAAVYGKPVIFGPEYEKYVEAQELIDCGGAYDVENSLELEETLTILLKDGADYKTSCEASCKYVHANKGATGKIMKYIQEKRLLTN